MANTTIELPWERTLPKIKQEKRRRDSNDDLKAARIKAMLARLEKAVGQ